MATLSKRKVIVIGHKNPDTDSICSAIGYAYLKHLMTGGEYQPMRAGSLNPETEFVLNYFGVDVPELITDVSTQVSDIEINQTEGVDGGISLKKAWNLMKDKNVKTLPVTKDGRLEGIITIGDIANSYMNVYDSEIISVAKTKYSNVVETVEGTMILGDMDAVIDHGKVLIAAANPDLMENYIDEGDIVILGNRYESQLCAIEMKAGCIIVCHGTQISRTIRHLAEDRGCAIISTPYDTYTVARLINQSMPISHFMRTDRLTTFQTDDLVDEVREVMASKRHRYFPILDEEGNYVGLLSRRNLLGMKRKQVILVDHNERSQAVNGIEKAEVMEIIDHHRLGTIETVGPVFFRNHPVGCTATIIFIMLQEQGYSVDPKIAGLLCSAIISDTLLYRSPTCTPMDKMAAEALAELAGIDTLEHAKAMFAAGSNLLDKTNEEIFYQDYKEFAIGNKRIGIGQISSMNGEELKALGERLKPCLKEQRTKRNVDMTFLMLTDILEESTMLLFSGGGNAGPLVEEAFQGVKVEDRTAYLPGVVSRKKQMVPSLTMVLQQ